VTGGNSATSPTAPETVPGSPQSASTSASSEALPRSASEGALWLWPPCKWVERPNVSHPPRASKPTSGLLEDDLKEWVIQQAAQLHQEYFASTGSAASAAATASAGSVLDRIRTLAKELSAPRNTAADDYALLVELAGVVSETSGSGISAFELSSSGLIPR